MGEAHMKRAMFIGAATAVAFSAAAFAQAPGTSGTPGTPAPTPDAVKTTQSSMSANPSFRQDMVNTLQKAGFTDVSVRPDSFVVEAKDKSGNPVTMLLGPGSLTEVTDIINPNAKSGDKGMFANIPAKEDLTSKVVGLSVYNNENKDIGTIKDVAFDNGAVKAYIIGVGGFIGMGDHYVAVRPSAVNLTYNAADKKWHAEMNTTAAQLKAAPEFKYMTNS